MSRRPVTEDQLTKREFEILDYFSRTGNVKQIKEDLGISRNTYYFHMANLREKFHANSSHQVVAFAFMDGILS